MAESASCSLSAWRDAGSIPAHSTNWSESGISGDRIIILGVVQIPHKAVGPVAVPTDW